MVIFLLPNTVFAWFEYITSLIKIFLFLLIITLSLALTFGAGPKGYIHHGQTWTEHPAFLNGFSVSRSSDLFFLEGYVDILGFCKRCFARDMGSGRPSLHRHHGR
jgi:amino acid permease